MFTGSQVRIYTNRNIPAISRKKVGTEFKCGMRYSVADVARVTGFSYSQIKYWIDSGIIAEPNEVIRRRLFYKPSQFWKVCRNCCES